MVIPGALYEEAPRPVGTYVVALFHLEDRIPELCARAVASDDTDFPNAIAELRAAMHEQIENLRRAALQQFAAEHERRTVGGMTLGKRAIRGDDGTRQRLRELTAKIATEQDLDNFTALVQEVNDLLDEENPAQIPSENDAGFGEKQSISDRRRTDRIPPLA